MAEDTTEEAISADDWGAAMAEQAAVETPAAQRHVFEQFGAEGGAELGRFTVYASTEVHSSIDKAVKLAGTFKVARIQRSDLHEHK